MMRNPEERQPTQEELHPEGVACSQEDMSVEPFGVSVDNLLERMVAE